MSGYCLGQGYSVIDAARRMARRVHADQVYPPADAAEYIAANGGATSTGRVGRVPFIAHPGHVVAILHRFGFGEAPALVAAAWLHDVLEDTDTASEEIADACGRDVLDLVLAVTDEPGETRDEKKAKTYPKIVAAGPAAVTLKVADRIANVEAAILGGGGIDFLSIYQREHPAFRAALDAFGPVAMWDHLGELLSERG